VHIFYVKFKLMCKIFVFWGVIYTLSFCHFTCLIVRLLFQGKNSMKVFGRRCYKSPSLSSDRMTPYARYYYYYCYYWRCNNHLLYCC